MNNDAPEIDSMIGRVSQGIASHLFIQVAEEHKKAGDLDKAIQVLLNGLESNPDNIAARAFLGNLLYLKGDLAGAQKAFEDVVNIAPDHLFALRRLGDIHILQNRPQDALAHYKSALSLNPSDEEFASLVSDVESDRDVRAKILLAKSRPAADQTIEADSSAAAMRVRAAASPMTESEEAEDVFIVEPLEPEQGESGPGFPGDRESSSGPSSDMQDRFSVDFSTGGLGEEEPARGEVISAGPELSQEMDLEASLPRVYEETAEEDIQESKADEELSETALEMDSEAVAGKSDDFTTDTLAELYIAQGFHDKAIEIYERMLADKPDSQGLKAKLEAVRAAAAFGGAPATDEKQGQDQDLYPDREAKEYVPAMGDVPSEPSFLDQPREYRPPETARDDSHAQSFAEAREYIPPLDSEDRTLETDVPEGLTEAGQVKTSELEAFPDFGEYKPVFTPEDEQVPPRRGFELSGETPVPEHVSTKYRDVDFEPREYIPPQTEVVETAVKQSAAQQQSVVGRQEAIARLETWLAKIQKEK